jgi:hypothetical protein
MANTKGLNEILPLQVAKGHVVEYQGQVFGDRGTLQGPPRRSPPG